jgi:hypothetical protein
MLEIYHWLVFTGGLWFSVVGWAVGWLLGLAVAWRPWKKHRKAQQDQIALLREIRDGRSNELRDRGDEGQPRR